MSFLQVRTALDRGVEGRSLAWALDFPGAFAYGKDNAEALGKLSFALIEYQHWIGLQSDNNWVKLAKFELQIVEGFDSYSIDENYAVNAFFEDDRRALNATEIERALKIYTWQRRELLASVNTLSPEAMTVMLPGQRWNINGILNHVGRVELSYLGNLGLPLPTAELLVHNPFKILELSFGLVQKFLPGLEGISTVFEHAKELWSPRKLVRRLLWHQRDHIEHIQQIVEVVTR